MRIEKSNQILLSAPIDAVFPLFDPVNEMKWVKGWTPNFVYPSDGTVEEQMIFTTPSRFPEEDVYHWVITKYIPEHYHVEYTVSTRERVWRVRVRCFPVQDSTTAEISYQFTGLTKKGIERNNEALAKMFHRDLIDWEEAINFYLETGTMKGDD